MPNLTVALTEDEIAMLRTKAGDDENLAATVKAAIAAYNPAPATSPPQHTEGDENH